MAFTIETKNGKRIRVDAESALIGRDRSCHIALPDQPDLQPIHAKIRKVADRWMIEAQGDWQIQVGTGQPGRMNWIKPGDVIRLTQTGLEITFLDGQPLAQAAPPPLATAQPPKKRVPEKSRTPTAKAPLPPDLPAAAEEWYYAKDGKKLGPCCVHQLKELAAKGQLAAADLVWKEGLAQWVPAQTIKGLFSTPPPSVPVSPPIRPSQPPAHVPAIASPSSQPVKVTSSLSGLMPVLIAQTVIAAIGFLFGFWGIIDLGPSDLRSLNGLFVCVAVGLNLGVLATTWLGYVQRSYWFSLLAARLMFGSWLLFLFTGCPIPVSILGLMISIPVGIWAINVLRKPDVREFLGSHAAPSDFSHTLLGRSLGSKWSGLNQKQKAITIGACVFALVLFVPLMSWIVAPNWPNGLTNKGPQNIDRDQKLAAVQGQRNQNLDDVIGKRNQNLDDVTGKRNQNLDDIIAKRNKKLGKISPPPSDTTKGPGPGGNDDQAIYQRGYDEGFSLGKLYAGRLAAMDAVTKREFAQTYQQELQTHEANLREITQAFGKDHPQVMAKMGFCNGLRTALAQAK